MSKAAEEAMNSFTIEEIRKLHVQGYCVITGNGKTVSVVREEMAEAEEIRRCENGY